MRISRLRPITLALSLASALALACEPAPTEAPELAGPDVFLAKPPSGTAVSVDVVGASPGLLPDGAGAYSTTIPNGSALDLRPSCTSPARALDLQGMGPSFGALGDRSTCNGPGGAGFVFLKLNASHTSPAGACTDTDAPVRTRNSWSFSASSRYFFQVDTDGDGAHDDTQYTLVLKDCLIAVQGDGSRRVTASVGDLYAGQSGVPLADFTNIAVTVDVTIRP